VNVPLFLETCGSFLAVWESLVLQMPTLLVAFDLDSLFGSSILTSSRFGLSTIIVAITGYPIV
jgi:hypothetical protein